MALVQSIEIDGVVYPESYSRITAVRMDKVDGYVFVCTYANEQARLDDAFPIKAAEYQLSREGLYGDAYVTGYAHLKTLPDFANATDH